MGATGFVVHEDPAPRLGKADGGGEHGLGQETIDEAGVDGIGKEMANVAAPFEELG